MRTLQHECRFDRGLRPAANRIRLEILLADAPALAEVGPEPRDVLAFDRQRGRTREAVAREEGRRYAGMRAPAGSVLDHRRRFAGAKDLTARTEVFGDAQRVARTLIV